uniref:Eukaryotic elongation factor 2 lysine methyltransferase n=1 Tax=Erpetoichthys calabaricus TaxID=27687 RepID=A0A8C4S8Y3_ERPCA
MTTLANEKTFTVCEEDCDLTSIFHVYFFAMCRLKSFPWSELETYLRDSASSALLSQIISKPTGDFVSLIENQAVISEGTTGLVTWEAALCLAEWAMEHTDIFQGRSILELGSGMGLTGITVCKMCRPHKYIFSDCHPNVLRQLQRNLSLNNLAIQEFASTGASNTSGVQIMVKNLDWEVASQEHFKDLCVDVVIASDVVYDPEIVPCLVKLLSQFLICAEKDKVPNMYIASTIRNHETYASFRRELEASGIRQNIIPGPRRRVFPYDRSSQIELIKLHL